MDEYQRQENNANGYQSPYGNANGYQQPYNPNGYQAPNNGANGYQQPYNPNGYQAPDNGANGYQQPYDMNGYRSYNDAMNGNPAAYGTVNAGDMPNKGLYLFLLIVGFICGILWGLLSIGPYKKMNAAIDANDSIEAKKQAKKIVIFVVIGIVLNALIFIGNMAQNGAF